MFHQSIVRVRAGVKTNRAGDEVPDWDNPVSRVPYERCVSIQPASTSEQVTNSRDVVVTGWRLFSAPGVDLDLLAVDRVEWDGVPDQMLKVVGEVGRWPDPLTGAVHHVEATLQIAEG